MIRLLAGLLALTTLLAPLAAQEAPAAPAPTPAADAGIHASFDALLQRYVENGVVDYDGLKENEGELDTYLAVLGRTKPSGLDRDERLALYINAYNAFTLKLILNWHGRIDGIKDIPSSKRWKYKVWSLGGARHSLDQIEHEILRPMGEPRIHFALVCASKSCPDLRSEAFVPARLDEQLSDATRTFLADPKKGLVTKTESGWFGGKDPNVYVSKIFSWFDDDFEKGGRKVVDFLEEYAPAEAVDYMRRWKSDLDVEYLDYDWTLNDARL